MANFNAMFAGCESFMEGDVEINNDVTMPDTGEALEAETVAEDVGAEGGEIAGEAETADTKAEAANMVFDQVLNMYRHVKRNGIDRTFLSLYNNQGQLNSMIGYRFPSCESMDSVGSPRSSSSQAFIAAMESDGIFSKIWEWIKEQWAKIVNFFRKVVDWFREACGNLDLRVGKLFKYFNSATDKPWKDVKNKTVKYASTSNITKYNDTLKKLADELGEVGGTVGVNIQVTSTGITGAAEGVMQCQKAMADQFGQISSNARTRSGATGANTYGKDRDANDKEGHAQLKQYIDRLNKDALEPYVDAIGEIGKESEELSKLGGKGGFGITIANGALQVDDHKYPGADKDDDPAGVKASAIATLNTCKDMLKGILKQRQAMDMMKRANEQASRQAEQLYRLEHGESQGYDASKEAKESTLGAVKFFSICVKILNAEEKFVAKLCKVIASYTSCVAANGSSTGSSGSTGSTGSTGSSGSSAPTGSNP